MIDYATMEDIPLIKKAANKHTEELGFIGGWDFKGVIEKQHMLVDRDSGSFCHFHVRKDGMTVIYEILTTPAARGTGLGRQMVNKLVRPVRAKCPEGLPSNGFYQKLGFELVKVEEGKKRKLNVWELH
jgi:GNAT superfamily N-acetyltransferase